MNRTDTARILQTRWKNTGQLGPGGHGGEERIDEAHRTLQHYDYQTILDRLYVLIDQGHKPDIADLVAGIRRLDWTDPNTPEPKVPGGSAAHARRIWQAAYETSGHRARSIDRLLKHNPGDAA